MALVVARAGSMSVARASVMGKKVSAVAEVAGTGEWSVKNRYFGRGYGVGSRRGGVHRFEGQSVGGCGGGSVVLMSGASMAMNVGDWVVKSGRIGVDCVNINIVGGCGVGICRGGV